MEEISLSFRNILLREPRTPFANIKIANLSLDNNNKFTIWLDGLDSGVDYTEHSTLTRDCAAHNWSIKFKNTISSTKSFLVF